MEAPLAPTPFSIFCTRVEKKDISWCRKKFPLLPDQERLKWIDLALAEGANYLVISVYHLTLSHFSCGFIKFFLCFLFLGGI